MKEVRCVHLPLPHPGPIAALMLCFRSFASLAYICSTSFQ